jgi:hypothetical protein
MDMSIERRYFSTHNFVWTKMQGCLTDAMFSDHVRKLTEETRDYISFSELADCRELKNVSGLTGPGIVDSALLEGERDPKVFGKLAILVSNSDLFGYISIYKVICEHYRKEVRICKDLDEALAWLGLDADSDIRRELS